MEFSPHEWQDDYQKDNPLLLIFAPAMNKQILPAVSAIILNDNREILCRSAPTPGSGASFQDTWNSGRLSEAILREVREEANALSEVVRLIGVYSSPEYTTYHYDDRIVQYVVSYFEVKLLSSIPPNFKNEETEQFKYFPIGALPA